MQEFPVTWSDSYKECDVTLCAVHQLPDDDYVVFGNVTTTIVGNAHKVTGWVIGTDRDVPSNGLCVKNTLKYVEGKHEHSYLEGNDVILYVRDEGNCVISKLRYNSMLRLQCILSDIELNTFRQLTNVGDESVVMSYSSFDQPYPGLSLTCEMVSKKRRCLVDIPNDWYVVGLYGLKEHGLVVSKTTQDNGLRLSLLCTKTEYLVPLPLGIVSIQVTDVIQGNSSTVYIVGSVITSVNYFGRMSPVILSVDLQLEDGVDVVKLPESPLSGTHAKTLNMSTDGTPAALN